MNKECKKYIDSIKQKYNYNYITDEEYELFIDDCLKKSNNQYNKEFYTCLEKLITTKIYQMKTIFKFIDNEINDSNNYLECMDSLKKICNYLILNQISIDISLISKLSTIDKINGILNNIIDYNIINIKNNHYQAISYDNNICNFIKIYSEVNGIEYDNSYDFYNEDNVGSYFKEIGSIPLLTPEEEQELALKMSKGDPDAKEKFILSNLRLVVSIAKRYACNGIPLLDLIEEGNIGLMIAADKFDINKGYKFSTYATHWIYQKILIALSSQSRIIRLPIYLVSKFRDVLKYKQECKKLGYVPTDQEIATKFDISLETVQILYREEESVISLNSPIQNDSSESRETTLELFLKSDENIEEDYEKRALIESVRLALENCNLNDNQKFVIKNYFGIDTSAKTLATIANSLKITRERVRQIKEQALKKMSRSHSFVKLENYCVDEKVRRR